LKGHNIPREVVPRRQRVRKQQKNNSSAFGSYALNQWFLIYLILGTPIP